MKICKKCIVPDSFPNISFKDGICSFCKIHEIIPHVNRDYKGENKLLEVLTSKKTDKYHCLLPLSGGKDSSYTLLYLTRKLGLNPLAAHFDSGFIQEKTKSNIEKLCQKLSVDLVIGHASEFRKKMLRESFLAARKGDMGGFTGIGGICVNCENNLRTFAIKEARKNNIPFIVWSSTDFEDSPDAFLRSDNKPYKQTYGESSTSFGLKRISKIYDSLMGDYKILKYFWNLPFLLHGARHFYYRIKDNIQMDIPGKLNRYDPFIEVSFKGTSIDVVYFYEYIKYDPFSHIKALNDEVGWEVLVGKEARQDCRLHHLANLRGFKRHGITNDGFFYSVLVREGLLSREEALEKERILRENLNQNAQEVLDELGVDVDVELLR